MQSAIAITGGSGFVGSALAKHLSEDFYVRILDKVHMQHVAPNGVEFVECDIRRYDEVQQAIEDTDLVIHTAIIQIPEISEKKRSAYEVNVIGTQNICEAVRCNHDSKGLILAGSWHVIGERQTAALIDEKFGSRPDFVEDRARFYVLSKIAQESIVRLYDEEANGRVYGILRIGTVLGDGMPQKTAANTFIDRAMRGEPLTPYQHSMYRPMLYVDVLDVCRAFKSYALKILHGKVGKVRNSLDHIVNVWYPEPITVLELAEIVRESVFRLSDGVIVPEIKITKTGEVGPFTSEDKQRMKVDMTKARDLLGLEMLAAPKAAIDRIVMARLSRT